MISQDQIRTREIIYARRCIFSKFFKHGSRNEPPCTGYRVVCFVPGTGSVDILENIEEVALEERKLLRGL
jgi:hypothetical protein